MAIDELWRLLDERQQAALARRAGVDARIWERFGRDCAVMVTDMARFSRITRDHGIVHFLALIRRMQTIARPIIEAHAGHLCKGIADNLYATFDSAQDAVDAAIAMRASVARDGAERGEDERIRLCIGIAAGEILDIDGEDMFGGPVNFASKLGEDIGSGDDILVTVDAAHTVQLPKGWRTESRVTAISAVEVQYVALCADA